MQPGRIWKFFSNPIICLDGDKSGQDAALRIAEKLFPIINDQNKIYFSVMPDGNDPDDYIKQNGKEKFISLLNEKKIIQNYIWDYHLKKIRTEDEQNNFQANQKKIRIYPRLKQYKQR